MTLGAIGNSQSPIDVRIEDARFDPNLDARSFEFNYDPAGCKQLLNIGENFHVKCENSTLTASHLPGTYQLVQFHGHWNTNPWNGSEHQILGVGKAGELHFVHWNRRYANFEEATKHKDGVAVLAVFLDESLLDNPDLTALLKRIEVVKRKGDTVQFPNGFPFRKLIPEKLDFWTYEGSLTTPPYTECVIWTVFKSPVAISYNQMHVLRNMSTGNNRAVQKLNGRLVRASFELGGRVVYGSDGSTVV